MKKILSLFTLTLLLCLSSCSKGEEEKETFNVAQMNGLITSYDANGGTLSADEYSILIKNTKLLFSDIKEKMKELMAITEPLRFSQEYQRLKQDDEFIESLVIREKVWRVLVLGQKGFSEQNREEFSGLPDECMLLDYYDDCIRARVTAEPGTTI